MKAAALILLLVLPSLAYRESTSPADYMRILKAIDESRESRRLRESAELRALIDVALRQRELRETCP